MIKYFLIQNEGIRLFLLAFLTLFSELALIRFASSEVLYLGYFTNFILISAFLGIGVGFLLATNKLYLFRLVPFGLLLYVIFLTLIQTDMSWFRENSGQIFFGSNRYETNLPIWLTIPIIFLTTTFIFICISQETGRCFLLYKPLISYSIDIVGSLFGIIIFSYLSYLGSTPVQWFTIIIILIIILLKYHYCIETIVIGCILITYFSIISPSHFVAWSPYQRVDVHSVSVNPNYSNYLLLVNGISHQSMSKYGTKEVIYDFPYNEVVNKFQIEKYDNVLIIGAGCGNDISYALNNRVHTIDAVEIDPLIKQVGALFHPDRPYDNPNVMSYINDGRIFMEHVQKKYDLIIFALPDSLASSSNFTNIRLESFLFTIESFRQAKKILNENGVLVLYNYYRQKWLYDKLSEMLTISFGHRPYEKIYIGENGIMLAALAISPSFNLNSKELDEDESIKPTFIPATDDWPFLYMQSPTIPLMYLLIMFMFILFGIMSIIVVSPLSITDARINIPFFLMGASFLLIETKSIIQFSLLFGSTWFVNSLVFSSILLSVLAANLLAANFNIKNSIMLYIGLLISLFLQIIIPFNSFLSIDYSYLRYTLASIFVFTPIIFANIIFSINFKYTKNSHISFGWNIIGAMVGGALEYTSLWLGYQKLIFIVAFLYILCFLWIRLFWKTNSQFLEE